MEEDLMNKWRKMNLSAGEDQVIEDDEGEGSKNIKDQIRLSLAGKVLTERPFSFESLKRTLMAIWRLEKEFSIRDLGSNLFMIQFYSEEDKVRVWKGQPWSFENNLFMLKEVEGDMQPSELIFDKCPFWIRVYDVPFGRRGPALAKKIGDSMGTFIDYDNSDPLHYERSMRIRVQISIDKPLRRGIKIATGSGEAKWVDFKYERLPRFCYVCGVLGHIEKTCAIREGMEGTDQVQVFGEWIRVSPLKRSTKMERDEYLKEKERLENMKEAIYRETIPRSKAQGRPTTTVTKQLFQNKGESGGKKDLSTKKVSVEHENQILDAKLSKPKSAEVSLDMAKVNKLADKDGVHEEIHKEKNKSKQSFDGGGSKGSRWKREARKEGRTEMRLSENNDTSMVGNKRSMEEALINELAMVVVNKKVQ